MRSSDLDRLTLQTASVGLVTRNLVTVTEIYLNIYLNSSKNDL